jgi:mRNA interferase MazF
MPPPDWFPQRGEIYVAALDKHRPVLIVSSNALNRHSLDVCVVPISTVEHRGFSLRPKLAAGEGGLVRDSWVKCDHVTTLEKQLVQYPRLGALNDGNMVLVERAIKRALELP